MANNITKATVKALDDFNAQNGTAWNFGTNWNAVDTKFENFVNNYLFPKINETDLVNTDLGNRFDFMAEETDFIAQYNEEYVIMDAVPTAMDLTKSAKLMLERNYPKMATRLYGSGILKKQKFTLNDNDVRLNFLTLADGVKYALAVFKKRISDINVMEEMEIKAMLVDYSLNHTADKRVVGNEQELATKLFEALLNLQNNSAKYNETFKASGGAIGRYTTTTDADKVAILTTDRIKTYLLDTKIANTFNAQGIDLTNRIISFDDLGGVFRLTEDVTVTNAETIEHMEAYGDYQIEKDEIIPAGTVFTYDISELTNFKGKVEEIKPENDLYAFLFDMRKVRYKRYTRNMVKPSFYNGEFDETTYWIHYYSSKNISPFFNNSVIVGG